jgi:hypothetical protein
VPVASVQDPTFRVEFDLAVLAEDSDHSTPKGRSVMRDAIRGLDRDGISASRLKACEDPGRDGTRLAGCAKTYLPPPDGSWGMVFQLRFDDTSDLSSRALRLGYAIPLAAGSQASTRWPTAACMPRMAVRSLRATPDDASHRSPSSVVRRQRSRGSGARRETCPQICPELRKSEVI